jgi:hypothetical protein
MFERYTERARRVLFFARYEASQLGSISIETEHLLLGLIREGKGLTSRLFARAHLSLEEIRREIERRTVFREKVSTSVEIPFSTEIKRVLQYAADEADRLLHNYIGTEHLLLGILREERSVAGSILTGRGMQLETVRADIQQLLTDGSAAAATIRGLAPVAIRGLAPAARLLEHWRFVPSETVHVMRSGTDSDWEWSVGKRHWLLLGADLRSLVARTWGIDPDRLEVPAQLQDGTCYDVVLLLPHDEPDTQMAVRVQRALEAQFRIAVNRESGPGRDRWIVTPIEP